MRKGVFLSRKKNIFYISFSSFPFSFFFSFQLGFSFLFRKAQPLPFPPPSKAWPFGPLASRSPAAFQRSGTEGATCAVGLRSGVPDRLPFHVVFLLLSQP